MRKGPLILVALIAAQALGFAQSIGEVARREAEKRKRQGQSKVYTDRDLQRYQGERPATPSEPQPAQSADSIGSPPAEKQAGRDRDPSTTDSVQRAKTTALKAQLERCEENVRQLRQALSEARSRGVRGSVWVAGAIRPGEREEDLVAERLKAAERQCTEIMDQARREGIPPGLLR